MLTYVGDMLGVDLYLAAVVTFGVRIFQNLVLIVILSGAPPKIRKPSAARILNLAQLTWFLPEPLQVKTLVGQPNQFVHRVSLGRAGHAHAH